MKGCELTISSYPHIRYAFTNPDDRHTIFEALQHPLVFLYMQNPDKIRAPAELARVISPSKDLYMLSVAEKLVEHNMVPQNDEQRELRKAFDAKRAGLLERAAFFYTILERDVKRSQSLPSIFYPLMYDYLPEQVGNQLYELMPNLPTDVQRIFFRLVFKFSRRTKRQMTEDAFNVCLLKWEFPRKQKQDPDSTVYCEAADAVWDYIEEMKDDYGACDGIESPLQLLSAWSKWLGERGIYPNFLARIQIKCNVFKHAISCMKHFIWKYLELGQNKRLKL